MVCRRRREQFFLDCQLGSAAFSQGVISGRHFLWRSQNLKFLMLITYVIVKIQLNLQERSLDSF